VLRYAGQRGAARAEGGMSAGASALHLGPSVWTRFASIICRVFAHLETILVSTGLRRSVD